MKKFIFLDRDGVINYDSPAYIKTPEEWIPIPGSLEAIAQLNRLHYHVIVISNQSGIGRGYYALDILNEIHEKFIHNLATVGGYVDEIIFCPHHPRDNCACRKPRIGMILQMQKKYNIELANTFFVGDSYIDMQAASLAGCKPLLVLTGNGEKELQEHPELIEIPHCKNLAEAIKIISK